MVVCGLLVTEAVMTTLPPAAPFFLRWWSPCVTVLSTPFRLTSTVRQSGSRSCPASFSVSSRNVVLGAMPGYRCALDEARVVRPLGDPTSVGEDVVHSPVQLLRSFEEGGDGAPGRDVGGDEVDAGVLLRGWQRIDVSYDNLGACLDSQLRGGEPNA